MTTEYSREEVKKELDDIKLTVHRLEATKQNKWPLPLILTVAIWCVGVTAGGSWWAATITESLSRMESAVQLASIDRYHKGDAIRDFELRDQLHQFLDGRIGENEQHLLQLEKEVDKLRDEVRDRHAK